MQTVVPITSDQRCSKCSLDKPATAFSPGRSQCKECRNAAIRFRRANPDGIAKPLPLVERFWSKVNKNGPIPIHRPELGPCWIWTAGRFPDGYGAFSVNRKNISAHRFSFEQEYGPLLPEFFGEVILHACDNPPCVRPSHLHQGTTEENVADRQAKKRTARGSQMPQTKLSEEAKEELRTLFATKRFTLRELGERFGVHLSTVARIVKPRPSLETIAA
jgi:hypothetical protein